ncbi:MAG: hypothetical protein HY010_13995 [Acidobacteria bacterium]|nr:hypothetical protein [Acidobacteriota bacterium]
MVSQLVRGQAEPLDHSLGSRSAPRRENTHFHIVALDPVFDCYRAIRAINPKSGTRQHDLFRLIKVHTLDKTPKEMRREQLSTCGGLAV